IEPADFSSRGPRTALCTSSWLVESRGVLWPSAPAAVILAASGCETGEGPAPLATFERSLSGRGAPTRGASAPRPVSAERYGVESGCGGAARSPAAGRQVARASAAYLAE